MKLGIHLPHLGRFASADAIRSAATTAEQLGYCSVWTGDHLAVPRRVQSAYGLSPEGETWSIPEGALGRALAPMYECTSTLAFVAGFTQRILLGTAVAVLPVRNPLYNARQLATIDSLSAGRVVYGVGPGWLREEADALQMPWDERGARTDEHIRLLRTLWTAPADYVSFTGRFYSFPEIAVEPRPAQNRVPILIGGHSETALKRVARLGDGWLAANLPAEKQRAGIQRIKQLADLYERDPGELQFFGAIPAEFDQSRRLVSPTINSIRRTMTGGHVERSPERLVDRVMAYKAAGTEHLVLQCHGAAPGEAVKLIEACSFLIQEVAD